MLLQLVLVYTVLVYIYIGIYMYGIMRGETSREKIQYSILRIYIHVYIYSKKMFAAVRNIPTQRHSDSVSLVFDACRCNVSSLKISNLRAT